MKSAMHLLLINDDTDDQFFFRKAVKDIDPSITCTTTYDGMRASRTCMIFRILYQT